MSRRVAGPRGRGLGRPLEEHHITLENARADAPSGLGQVGEHLLEALTYALPAPQHVGVRDEDRVFGVVADDAIEVAGDHRFGVVLEDVLGYARRSGS
jgi:hypothetical protein